MMRTGEVEANIIRLNADLRLPYIDELIAQKRAGGEKEALPAGHDLDFYTREYERLMEMLIASADASPLPKMPQDGARGAKRRLDRVADGVATLSS
jgi:hypothetical protein